MWRKSFGPNASCALAEPLRPAVEVEVAEVGEVAGPDAVVAAGAAVVAAPGVVVAGAVVADGRDRGG